MCPLKTGVNFIFNFGILNAKKVFKIPKNYRTKILHLLIKKNWCLKCQTMAFKCQFKHYKCQNLFMKLTPVVIQLTPINVHWQSTQKRITFHILSFCSKMNFWNLNIQSPNNAEIRRILAFRFRRRGCMIMSEIWTKPTVPTVQNPNTKLCHFGNLGS